MTDRDIDRQLTDQPFELGGDPQRRKRRQAQQWRTAAALIVVVAIGALALLVLDRR